MSQVDDVSPHYRGDRGAAYVQQRQSEADHAGYAVDARFFSPHIKSTDSVLDFGCGNGGMLPHFKRVSTAVQGVEVNDAARAIALGRGFSVHAGLDHLPADARFDVVVTNHVLEHVPNVVDVLRAIRRHIAPGGKLVAKLPIDDIRSKHQLSWSRDDVDHHLQTWTPRLFANVLYEAGFEVSDIAVVTSAWHPRLFPLIKTGLHRPAFWAMAMLKNRRQLLAVATNPSEPE